MKYLKNDDRPMHTDKVYHRDCFAFQAKSTGGAGCIALVKMDCMNCKFYKTKITVAEEQRKTVERLTKRGLSDLIDYKKGVITRGR